MPISDDHIVSAKCKQGYHRLVLKNFKKNIPNIHENSEHHKTESANPIAYLPYSQHWVFLWKSISVLPDLFNSSNWWTALYKSSSRSPLNVLLNKICVSDVARHMAPSIRITCRVIATKERKSINWNLSQYQKTTFQGIPIVNIRQPETVLLRIELLHSESEAGIHQLLRFLLK